MAGSGGWSAQGARGHVQSSGKFSLLHPRSGPRGVLNAPSPPRRGRTRKLDRHRLYPPNERARSTLAQPGNVGKAYLKPIPGLGWLADMNIGVVARTTRALTSQFSAFGSSDDPDQIFIFCLLTGAKFHYSFADIQ